MNKLVIFLTLLIIFEIHSPSQTLAKGGLIKSIMNIFKEGSNKIIKTGDDTIKSMGKTKDELLERIRSKTTNETISTSSAEAKITENVGTNQHSQNFNNLKDYPRAKYIKNLKNKFNRGDDLADAADFFDIDLNSDSKSNLNKGFYSLVIINWIGRIYKESKYFSKPEEKKMLLMCSTNKDIFYIALLMEQKPKRAFIHQHIKIKNKLEKVRKMNPQETVIIRENAEIKPQELAILSDTDEIKIMSTLPELNEEWPSNYFTIYKNKGFEYDNLKTNFASIKKKVNINKKHKFNCHKSTKKGLL